MYGWIITKDLLWDENPEWNKEHDMKNNKGTIGPSGTILDKGTIVTMGKKFRMKDDDGEIYYEGMIFETDMSETTGFEPLDEFGMPNAGCVSIEYLENGRWVRLYSIYGFKMMGV